MIRFVLRWTIRALLAVVSVVVLYFAVTAVQVWLTSRQYHPVHASAAVVMGAAQYDGVPSPDLAARLDEALLLWHQGYVHLIVVTGYKEPGDRFTEAQASAKYLAYKGVPSSDILEAGGDDSYGNLTGAVALLRPRGDTTVLMVTDPFHEDRSMGIASELGLTPSPTPTRTSPIKGWSTVPYFAKETISVGVGRIIGYQNMNFLRSLDTRV